MEGPLSEELVVGFPESPTTETHFGIEVIGLSPTPLQVL